MPSRTANSGRKENIMEKQNGWNDPDFIAYWGLDDEPDEEEPEEQ